MITTTEFRTPEETALQLELLLLGTLLSRDLPEGPIAALPVTDARLQRELRRLADRIQVLRAQGEDGIGIIGAVPSSRRAMAAVCIAACVAPKRSVTLVDADLRAAHLSFDEGTYAQEGLVDVLRYGVRSPRVIAPTQIPGVSLLPVGSGTVDLAGTWASDALEPLLRELARSGDFLVVNGPGIEDLEEAGPFLDRISSWMLLHEIGASDTEATRRIRDRIGSDKLVGVLVFQPSDPLAEAQAAPESVREVLKTRSAESVKEEVEFGPKRGRKFTGLFVVAGAAAILAAVLIPRLFSQSSSESLSDPASPEEPWIAEEIVPPPVEESSDGIVEPLEQKPILTRSAADEPVRNSASALPTEKTSTPDRTIAAAPPSTLPSRTDPSRAAPSGPAETPPPSTPVTKTPSGQSPPSTGNPVPPEPAQKPAPSSGSYGVHVCSMKTLGKANEEAARYQVAGFPTLVRRVDLAEKGIWHRVYTGPYENRAAADRASEEIRTRGLTNFTLVQRIPGKQAASGS